MGENLSIRQTWERVHRKKKPDLKDKEANKESARSVKTSGKADLDE